MNYKTMILWALLAGTMQNAWGMQGGNPQYMPSAPLMSPSNSIRPRNNPLPYSDNNAMQPAVNNNNNAVSEQVISEIARLTAALEALNTRVANMHSQLNGRMTCMEQQIKDVTKSVEELKGSLDRIGEAVAYVKHNVERGEDNGANIRYPSPE